MYSVEYYKRSRVENPIKVVTREQLSNDDMWDLVKRRCDNIKSLTLEFKDVESISQGLALSDIGYLYDWCKKNKVKNVRIYNDSSDIELIMFEILISNYLLNVDEVDGVLDRLADKSEHLQILVNKMNRVGISSEEYDKLRRKSRGELYDLNYLLCEYREYLNRQKHPSKIRARHFKNEDLKKMQYPSLY